VQGWGWGVGSVLVVLVVVVVGECIVCLAVWGAAFGCFFLLAFARAAGDVRTCSVVWVGFLLELLVPRSEGRRGVVWENG
jgi:hypothetical protein